MMETMTEAFARERMRDAQRAAAHARVVRDVVAKRRYEAKARAASERSRRAHVKAAEAASRAAVEASWA